MHGRSVLRISTSPGIQSAAGWSDCVDDIVVANVVGYATLRLKGRHSDILKSNRHDCLCRVVLDFRLCVGSGREVELALRR